MSYSHHPPAKFDPKISTCESPVNHWWITTRVNYYWFYTEHSSTHRAVASIDIFIPLLQLSALPAIHLHSNDWWNTYPENSAHSITYCNAWGEYSLYHLWAPAQYETSILALGDHLMEIYGWSATLQFLRHDQQWPGSSHLWQRTSDMFLHDSLWTVSWD